MERELTEFFRMTLANIDIEVECRERFVFWQCRDYLSDFDVPNLSVGVSLEEIRAVEETLFEPITEHFDGVATTRSHAQSESLVVQRKIADGAVTFGAILMHGAVVACDGQAYMFTAPSGVGKTTRTRLWLNEYPDSVVINGDKPLIRVYQDEIIACGTPWCGKEGWNTNATAPLKAILLLERAEEGEHTSIEKVKPTEAFPVILQQTHKPQDPLLMRRTIDLLATIAERLAIYRFRSTPTTEAIRLAYDVISR